jgi:signal peptidase II
MSMGVKKRQIGMGLVIAALTLAIDQGHKYWMLGPFDIASRQPVRFGPYLDLVLAWNRGISYGWFSQDTALGKWLLVALALGVAGFLVSWLVKAHTWLSGVALGVLIGGALSNALDRVLHGAVADFFAFHGFGYSWYVFNVADVAIVAGVGVLLYESIFYGPES